jgi:hypothetical protein
MRLCVSFGLAIAADEAVRMNDASSFVGTLRLRFEFLVTVPEPSASLGLQIGALTLFGLASLRG